MTKEQIQNSQERLFSSIDDMFNDIYQSLDVELEKLNDHLDECAQEIHSREKEGKSITILQKNVLLNLLQQRTNYLQRLEVINIQQQHIINILSYEEDIQWKQS